MFWFERWREIGRLRIRSLARRERVDAELDRELQFHVEQQTAENIGRGMAPADARLAALRRIGGVTQIERSAGTCDAPITSKTSRRTCATPCGPSPATPPLPSSWC